MKNSQIEVCTRSNNNGLPSFLKVFFKPVKPIKRKKIA